MKLTYVGFSFRLGFALLLSTVAVADIRASTNTRVQGGLVAKSAQVNIEVDWVEKVEGPLKTYLGNCVAFSAVAVADVRRSANTRVKCILYTCEFGFWWR